jgi:hypothetical protein
VRPPGFSKRETDVRRKACGKCTLRFGGYRTPELDVTPALCIGLIVTVLGLIIQTGF